MTEHSAKSAYDVITPGERPPIDIYRLLLSVVVPRPIAWISTVGRDGTRNLAPFSFFKAVGGNPPVLMVSIGSRRGVEKDSLRNLRETGRCVVHIVSEEFREAMNATSAEYDYDVDEFSAAEIPIDGHSDVQMPQIEGAPIRMEAAALQFVPVSTTGYTVTLLQVNCLRIRSDLLRADGTVDPLKLKPIARLGGEEYTYLGEVFRMPRPPLHA